jgi:hypothetical protein
LFTTGGSLKRRETHPGGKVAPLHEGLGRRRRRCERRRCHRAHPGYRREPSHLVVLFGTTSDFEIEPVDPLGQEFQRLDELVQNQPGRIWQIAGRIFNVLDELCGMGRLAGCLQQTVFG